MMWKVMSSVSAMVGIKVVSLISIQVKSMSIAVPLSVVSIKIMWSVMRIVSMVSSNKIMSKIFDNSVTVLESVWCVVVSVDIMMIPVAVTKFVWMIIGVHWVVSVVTVMRSSVDWSSVMWWKWSRDCSGSQYGTNEGSHTLKVLVDLIIII